MKEFNLFGYQVEIDEVATKEWYNKANEWGCECGDCRHFVALAKRRKLPPAVIEILEQFGISPQKATYVCRIDIEEHKLLYQFSYRVAGNIIKDRNGVGANDFDWGGGYCVHESYPYGAPGFPTPHFDLEFWMRLPKHKYHEIADFLMHGREIEFVYKDRECAITNHTSRWWFYDGVEQVEVCEFSDFETLVNKVAEYIIDDRTVQDIFDGGLYEKVSVL